MTFLLFVADERNNEIDIIDTGIVIMPKLIDITHSPAVEVLDILLKDRTTGKNIIWATDAYEEYGEGFLDKNQIYQKMLIGQRALIIRPRIEKTLEEQQLRTRKKAEVFTPAWLCNQMNNFCDQEWFGRKNVFNTEDEVSHTWTANENKIEFSEEKPWEEYINSTRLEITCGEAPFLVSRYDTSTGLLIEPTINRIGLLDRKLRVVGENTETEEEWKEWVKKAYQNIYGYEYQGDNLLIARVNLFLSLYDYYGEKFDGQIPYEYAKEIATIISWNLWQMDGLQDTVPLGVPFRQNEQLALDLFGDDENQEKEEPKLCIIKDWKKGKKGKNITFKALKG